jgi:hypothetical protein
LTIIHFFSEQVLFDDPQDLKVQTSEDPEESFSPFWHFFVNFEFNS